MTPGTSGSDGTPAAGPVIAAPRRPGAARQIPAITSGPVRTTLLVLALPVFGEQILNTFVGLFDTWLAGQISATATAAVGLAAYVSWLASMIVMLVGTGTTALVSRHEGRGDHSEANHYTNQSMTLAVILGGVVLVFLYTSAPWLARYSNMTGQRYDITVHYLQVDAVGHMFMSLTLVGSAALRGVGDMRTPMFIFAIINAVNVVASCIYVYGMGMGVNGIVAGTVTARVVGAFLMVIVLLRGRSGLILRRSELSMVWARTWRILRIGIPAAADGAIMWSGHFAFLAIIARVAPGHLGEVCFAAHIVAVRVEALTYLPAMAWGAAAATMIGQSLGTGDPARARRVGREAVLQCGLLSVGIALLFYCSAEWIYDRMTVDPLVRAAGVIPFRILAVMQPLLVMSIVFVHALRGAGDTRVPLLITIVGVFIRIPVGYYFGITAAWGLLGAWMGMFGDMVWRAMAASLRFVNGRWVSTKV